jgi:hypothetical protein
MLVTLLIVSDVLDSDHLPTVFQILDHVRTRNLSDPIEKFTNCERFQSLASDLVSHKIQINSRVEADKAAHDFTASIASAYRLSTCKVSLSYLNSDLSGSDRLLKNKQRLRKLWHKARDPACKTAINRVAKTIRMTRRKSLERWETRMGNCEVTPQAIWPTAKPLMKTDGPRAPTAIHGPLGFKFYPLQKEKATADCLENLFTPHDLCDENNERRVEARIQALLESVDNNPPERIRPCDVLKLIRTLKFKKACGIDGIQNECLRYLPRRSLVHLTQPGKDPKYPQNLCPISLTGKRFEVILKNSPRAH